GRRRAVLLGAAAGAGRDRRPGAAAAAADRLGPAEAAGPPAEPGAQRAERQLRPQRGARPADGRAERTRDLALPLGPAGRRGVRGLPAQPAGPDRRPQPGRAGGCVRLPPAGQDVPGGRGHRAGRDHQLRPDGYLGPPDQPLSAAMIARTAASVSWSSGWLSGSGQCDSLTTTVWDGGWTNTFWPPLPA